MSKTEAAPNACLRSKGEITAEAWKSRGTLNFVSEQALRLRTFMWS